MMNKIHSIAYSSDQETGLRPSFKLRFERLPNSSGRGFCLVDISITNNGDIEANFPFLCITELGLNLAPATGWAQRDIKLVRKMKRFSTLSESMLKPKTEVHCCTIILRSNFHADECLEFEQGSRHPLSALPDLNLVCVVGAGNHPSTRISLQIPAKEIKATIEQSELRVPELSKARA